MKIIEDGITSGIEFETDFLTPDLFYKKAPESLQRLFNPTHDASVETDALIFNEMVLKNNVERLSLKRIVIGTELVSNILNSDEESFLNIFTELSSLLTEIGEPEKSLRSGIHFHISLTAPPMKVIKNILILGGYYEKLFFRLGGMGYKFRGEKNDSIYCRPLTEKGPPCVRTKNGWTQIFNLEKLKKTQNYVDFWENYADSFNFGTSRYTPARYIWLNILGLFPGNNNKKTVEFRIFNKSLNPHFIFAAFLMAKNLVHLAISESYRRGILNKKINSVYDSNVSAFDLLSEFILETEIEDKWAKILFKLLENTPEVNLKNEYVKSHLYNTSRSDGIILWREMGKDYTEIIPEEIIKNPDYVDIHILRGE